MVFLKTPLFGAGLPAGHVRELRLQQAQGSQSQSCCPECDYLCLSQEGGWASLGPPTSSSGQLVSGVSLPVADCGVAKVGVFCLAASIVPGRHLEVTEGLEGSSEPCVIHPCTVCSGWGQLWL